MTAHTDAELIAHLDFDAPTPPCENQEGCDQPAAWRIVCACVGCDFAPVVLFCTRDKVSACEIAKRLGFTHTDPACGQRVILVEVDRIA
jgi:hypothetical protein